MKFMIYVNSTPLGNSNINFKDLKAAQAYSEKLKKVQGTIFISNYSDLKLIASKPEGQPWRYTRNKIR